MRKLKDANFDAAMSEGGGSLVAYLRQHAREQPAAFLTLLGKVLPLQIRGDANNRRVVDPKEPTHDQAHLIARQPDR